MTFPFSSHLYPEERPGSDRVVDQLMYVTGGGGEQEQDLKTILLWNGLGKIWRFDLTKEKHYNSSDPEKKIFFLEIFQSLNLSWLE